MSSISPLRTIPLRLFRRLIIKFTPYSVVAGSRSGLWARIHYTIVNRSFIREQRSFLAGLVSYDTSLHSPSENMVLLRRNAHRLEKGILMKPRRVPFAVSYIDETVAAFVVAVSAQSSAVASVEIAWANDVLVEYFDIHVHEESVREIKSVFESVQLKGRHGSPRIPYRRDLSILPSVSFDALRALAKRRRSVRWFLPRPVERHLLDQALEVGALGPSACNRQPFQFRFFDDHDLVQKIIGISYGLAGYGHQVPVVAVVVGQQRHFFDERDRHLIYIDASLAVMGFLFGLETLGLSSCCVNWPDIEAHEREMTALLGLSSDERPIMLIALGYPDPTGMVANSTKKSLNQLRTYNFE